MHAAPGTKEQRSSLRSKEKVQGMCKIYARSSSSCCRNADFPTGCSSPAAAATAKTTAAEQPLGRSSYISLSSSSLNSHEKLAGKRKEMGAFFLRERHSYLCSAQSDIRFSLSSVFGACHNSLSFSSLHSVKFCTFFTPALFTTNIFMTEKKKEDTRKVALFLQSAGMIAVFHTYFSFLLCL